MPGVPTRKVGDTSHGERIVVGLLASFPLLGGLAAFSTLEVANSGALAKDAMRRGMVRGALRWLPFAVGSSLYYECEWLSRSIAYRMATMPDERGDGSGGIVSATRLRIFGQRAAAKESAALSQYEQLFGRDVSHEHETLASKALAGAAASGLTLAAMRAVRWPGIGSLATTAGLACGCGLAAVAMPSYDDVARRVSAFSD